ncbi:hypothetical protein CDIK_1686 [Cucumispora dikerogammari]|nr:hypothetical protein CDIK_1686 [Cucumispora dikerogammari]
MNINSTFHKLNSKALLFDFGIEGNEFHIKHFFNKNVFNKKNIKTESCLYCIKDLYKTVNQINYCNFNINNTIIKQENIIINSVTSVSLLISIFFKIYFPVFFNNKSFSFKKIIDFNFICGDLKKLKYQKIWIDASIDCFYCF